LEGDVKADATHDAGDRRIVAAVEGTGVGVGPDAEISSETTNSSSQCSQVSRIQKRENAEARGKRYLTEGRLQIREVSVSRILATCRGTGATYELGFLNGVWFCECPARSRCSHLWSLELVTSR
jgi:hypothetical protein